MKKPGTTEKKRGVSRPPPPPAAAAAEGAKDPNEDDLGLVEYPLLEEGTSLMHYAGAAKSADDFPNYRDRMAKYQHWAERGFDATAHDPRRVPVLLDYPQLISVFCTQERYWRTQIEFSEMVMEHADKHILGYWALDFPSARTLDTLCSRSAYSRVLSREPREGLEFHHHYDELANPQSRFYKCIADWKKVNPKAGLACVYLMEFLPRDVRLVHGRFPLARIIGITTPRPDGADAKEIAAILQQKQEHKPV